MDFTYTDYLQIEKMLTEYYEKLKLIELNRKQIEKLQERLERTDNDCKMASHTFILNPNIKAITYDKVNIVGGSLPCSMIDRQIDTIFTKIEEEKESLNKQILLSNILIRKLESENDFVEKMLGLLNEENRQIIKLKYYYKLSYDDISVKSNISRGNIGKQLKKIKRDLIRGLRFSKEKNNGDKTATKRL